MKPITLTTQINRSSKNTVRCADYDDPTKIIDESADEYLCEYCGFKQEGCCDGKGNITNDINKLQKVYNIISDGLSAPQEFHKLGR